MAGECRREARPETSGGAESPSLFRIILANGRGDFGALPWREVATARTLLACQRYQRNYVNGVAPWNREPIGASAWYAVADAGLIVADGVPVARISYNGRVWWLDPNGAETGIEVEDLDITPNDL